MACTRVEMLRDKYNEMVNKKMISIGDIDDLMAQVDKVMMEIKRVTDSRDSWKAQYKLRNDDAKDYVKEIQKLEKRYIKLCQYK